MRAAMDWTNLVKVVAVLALLVVAAALATPPGRLPLALRGLNKLLRRDWLLCLSWVRSHLLFLPELKEKR